MLAGIVGYTFQSAPGKPTIELQADDFSGDNSHSSTIGTFNAMYPRLPYFAELALFVPSNLKDVRPVLVFDPIKDVQATFGWDLLWRASKTDGLYGSGLVEYAATNSSKVALVVGRNRMDGRPALENRPALAGRRGRRGLRRRLRGDRSARKERQVLHGVFAVQVLSGGASRRSRSLCRRRSRRSGSSIGHVAILGATNFFAPRKSPSSRERPDIV